MSIKSKIVVLSAALTLVAPSLSVADSCIAQERRPSLDERVGAENGAFLGREFVASGDNRDDIAQGMASWYQKHVDPDAETVPKSVEILVQPFAVPPPEGGQRALSIAKRTSKYLKQNYPYVFQDVAWQLATPGNHLDTITGEEGVVAGEIRLALTFPSSSNLKQPVVGRAVSGLAEWDDPDCPSTIIQVSSLKPHEMLQAQIMRSTLHTRETIYAALESGELQKPTWAKDYNNVHLAKLVHKSFSVATALSISYQWAQEEDRVSLRRYRYISPREWAHKIRTRDRTKQAEASTWFVDWMFPKIDNKIREYLKNPLKVASSALMGASPGLQYLAGR